MKKSLFGAAAVAAGSVVLIAALLFCFFDVRVGTFLVLRDEDDGRVYARYPVKEGDEFSVEFVHSVNKSPVRDVYQVREDAIYVVRTTYYAFGAGVQTLLEDGQTLTYEEDGAMTVSGFDKEIPYLVYFVGTVSEHTLRVGDETVALGVLCGRNSNVRFLIKKQLVVNGRNA